MKAQLIGRFLFLLNALVAGACLAMAVKYGDGLGYVGFAVGVFGAFTVREYAWRFEIERLDRASGEGRAR